MSYHFQTTPLFCLEDECAAGYCMDGNWGSNYCICPITRYGKFCELHTAPPATTSFKFNGKTSFLAIPMPKKSKSPFSVELNLNVKPREDTTTDQIIAYMGAEIGQEKSSFMTLAIQGTTLVNIYSDKQGRKITKTVASIEPGRQRNVKLFRTNQQIHIEVDGRKTGAVVLADPEEHLYLGGFIPGTQPNHQIASQFGYFSGCIDLVSFNNEDIEAQLVTDKFLSGDLESCEESIQATTSTTSATPTTTISLPSSTTAPETPSTPSTKEITTTSTSTTPLPSTTTRTTTPATTISLPPTFTIYPTIQKEETATLLPFIGLCDSKTCGEHGECEPLNSTHVICSCRDYYTGPTCNDFKPIDYAAKFQGNAFIVFSGDDFPHLTSEKEEIIELRLKTSARYGAIFWQGQHPESTLSGEDYVSIGLNDGYILFSYELGGGAAQLMSQVPVNDGREHLLRASRKGRNGTLAVDDYPAVHGTSSGILAMLNVEGNIYIGGLPDLASMTAGLHNHNLVGCIAQVVLNEKKMDLMAHAIDGRNVRACDSWRKTKRRFFKGRRRARNKQGRRKQL